MPSDRIVIAGGSGFLGRSLGHYLGDRGYEVVLISRTPPTAVGPWTHAAWDGRSLLGSWARHVDGAVAVVNLAGRSVDCPKTPEHCDAILRSRVESTRALGEAARVAERPPAVWVQMSTAHIYGDPLDVPITEESSFGYGLAPYVGLAWEGAFAESAPPTLRRVVLRTSFVLGRHGGALRRLERLTRLGLGGRVGDGRQGISWIHAEDLNRLFLRAITDASMSGAYIATAPQPVSNAEFMRALRRAVGMPLGLPAAAWMVRLAAPVLRTDADLAIYGRYCRSRRLEEEQFTFRFPEVSGALRDLYGVSA